MCGTGAGQQVSKTLLNEADALLYEKRYRAIFSCCKFGESVLKQVGDMLRDRILERIVFGNTTVVDEEVYQYFGKDAYDLNILMFFPGKEHDYGLVNYKGVQRLL